MVKSSGSMIHGKSLQNVIGQVVQREVSGKKRNFLQIEIDLDDNCKLPDNTPRVTQKGNVLVATTGSNSFIPGFEAFGLSLNVWKQQG